MKHRSTILLLQQETTPELITKLNKLVEGATVTEKQELASLALSESHRGSVYNPINGFVLYLFCVNESVSLDLLRDHYRKLDLVVFPGWSPGISRLSYAVKADDERVRRLASETFNNLRAMITKNQ